MCVCVCIKWFAFAEDYKMDFVVDMYVLKAVSEVLNGKMMVKTWNYVLLKD